jgi:hypothetical protein
VCNSDALLQSPCGQLNQGQLHVSQGKCVYDLDVYQGKPLDRTRKNWSALGGKQSGCIGYRDVLEGGGATIIACVMGGAQCLENTQAFQCSLQLFSW